VTKTVNIVEDELRARVTYLRKANGRLAARIQKLEERVESLRSQRAVMAAEIDRWRAHVKTLPRLANAIGALDGHRTYSTSERVEQSLKE
jgi:uncharacterized protein YlxW (UPF0749 family)